MDKASAEPPIIHVHQDDWMPGFGAFWRSEAGPGQARISINLRSLLATVETGDIPKGDLPYVVAETIMHEVMHALEWWAGQEFSEERIDELLARYREAAGRSGPTPTGAPEDPHTTGGE